MRTSSIALILAFTGCATAPPIVPASDWECVSPKARTTLDAQSTVELAHVRAEVTTAQAVLAEARRAHHVAAQPATATALPTDAIWGPLIADREQRKVEALKRITAATEVWSRARLAWSEEHLRTATAHLAVALAQQQLARASYIDRHLLGTDTYDTAPFRGELARQQTPYYSALHDEATARAAFADATAKQTSAKEEYAQLARTTPTTAPTQERYQLAGFTIDRHPRPSYLKLNH
jgi:hypothetical protein